MASVMWDNVLNYLDKLISSFDEFLTLDHASKQTKKNYKSDLHAFFTWLTTVSDTPKASIS